MFQMLRQPLPSTYLESLEWNGTLAMGLRICQPRFVYSEIMGTLPKTWVGVLRSRLHNELPEGGGSQSSSGDSGLAVCQVLTSNTYCIHPQIYFGFVVQSTHPDKRMTIQIIQR